MQEGHTAKIYRLISSQHFAEAAAYLQAISRLAPGNRATLSLLGYCYYQLEDFEAAARAYGTLATAHPSVPDYRLHWSQSLFKAGQLAEAARAAAELAASQGGSEPSPALALLTSAIRFEQGDLKGCRAVLEALPPEDPGAAVNAGCVLYREGAWVAASEQFTAALQAGGFSPEVAYGLAACQYRQRDYAGALATIGDIVELGVHEHPEMGVGSAANGLEVRTVGNSTTLRRTALVEALNLRAAIELEARNPAGAAAALADMPPRAEHELDPVTLHNQALVGLATGGAGTAEAGLDKLAHLLAHPPFPPETLSNLLSLTCRPGGLRPGLAEKVLAGQPGLVAAHLPPELAAFYQACAGRRHNRSECEARLDAIAGQHVESLRKLVKQVQDARWANDQVAAAQGLVAYEAALEAFVPVLMSLANLHWEAGDAARTQEVLQQSAEFCGDHATWRLNLAHALVAQPAGARLEDAAELYESILQHFTGGGVAGSGADTGAGGEPGAAEQGQQHGGGSILDVPPSALANLCVCYVVLSQNEVAEDLLHQLEDATAAAQTAAMPLPPLSVGAPPPAAPPLPPHLSLANLAIGRLYCAKGNFEFGIGRVMRALEPLGTSLDAPRWASARACFLAMLDAAAKQMLALKDGLVADLLAFLEDVAEAGRGVPVAAGAAEGGAGAELPPGAAVPDIRSEARAIHAMLLKLCD